MVFILEVVCFDLDIESFLGFLVDVFMCLFDGLLYEESFSIFMGGFLEGMEDVVLCVNI